MNSYIFYSERCEEEKEQRKAKTLKEVFQLIENEPEELGIARQPIARVCIERQLTCKLLFWIFAIITTHFKLPKKSMSTLTICFEEEKLSQKMIRIITKDGMILKKWMLSWIWKWKAMEMIRKKARFKWKLSGRQRRNGENPLEWSIPLKVNAFPTSRCIDCTCLCTCLCTMSLYNVFVHVSVQNHWKFQSEMVEITQNDL